MMTGQGRLWLILSLSVLLVSCSRVQLAYNQLDWLIPYYVDGYIDLNAKQDSYLDGEVDRLLQWHCGSQLTTYAELIRNANRDLQQASMDAPRLQFYLDEIESFWKTIKRQASPAIARLFLTSDPSQIEDFFSGLDERNREWVHDFRSQNADELAEGYRERMSDELERWFGPLSARQQQRVSDWSRQFQPLGMEGLAARQRWQARLQALFDRRSDEPAFYAGIEALFVNPETGQPAPYLARLELNQNATIRMLVEVSAQMSEHQRGHLDRMAGALASDFEQLACSGESLKPQPAEESEFSEMLLDLY